MSKKKVFSAVQKVKILRKRLDNHGPVAELFERRQITPNNFYRWEKKLSAGTSNKIRYCKRGHDKTTGKGGNSLNILSGSV